MGVVIGCGSVAAVVALVRTRDGLPICCKSRWPRLVSIGCERYGCGTIGGTVLPGHIQHVWAVVLVVEVMGTARSAAAPLARYIASKCIGNCP